MEAVEVAAAIRRLSATLLLIAQQDLIALRVAQFGSVETEAEPSRSSLMGRECTKVAAVHLFETNAVSESIQIKRRASR